MVIRELLGKIPSVDPGFSVCWQASSTHLKSKVKTGSLWMRQSRTRSSWHVMYMGLSKTRVWNFGGGYCTKHYLWQTNFSYISYLSLKYLEAPNKVMPLAMAYLVSKYSTARITASLLTLSCRTTYIYVVPHR